MEFPLSSTNVLKTEFEALLSDEIWLDLLMLGDFYTFEKLLHEKILGLYDKISEALITFLSKTPEFISAQKSEALKLGLKKLAFRPLRLRIRTGSVIEYDSLYAKVAPIDHEGSRHLTERLWQIEQNCSPMYRSVNCLYSVLCPSFEVSKSLLQYQGIKANYEKVREVSLGLATDCITQRTCIQLESNESLAGQKVVISMDGGRSRMRIYETDKKGRAHKYETPWREPKMFVITTCDEAGKLNKIQKPIYDGTFGDDETFELLAAYLKHLKIEQAESVQFLADGAPWIWNRVKSMLLSLGVSADKVIETLDYYHASQHVNEMKVYFDEGKKDTHFNCLKQALWKGDFSQMTKWIKAGIKGVNLEEFTPYKYFKKQQNRIDYQRLREEKRPCGSGIIESAIRRIINLRFKSPSSFWYPENVEKLIFMRGVALSGRWEIMMNNKFCSQ